MLNIVAKGAANPEYSTKGNTKILGVIKTCL
jgi:hypothetical protein